MMYKASAYTDKGDGYMKDDISKALLGFYEKILEPEFRSIKEKLNEHDDKFNRLFDHFDTFINVSKSWKRNTI